MKVFNITDEIEIHLQGNQAFIYSGDKSDVLNIVGIEKNPNAKEIVQRELVLANNASFSNTVSLDL